MDISKPPVTPAAPCGNQIFRAVPDHRVVFGHLDTVAHRNEKFFVIDDVVYKRLRYCERIFTLCNYLRPFYHSSKQKYIDKSTTHSGFLTVLRQLCRLFGIECFSKVVYKNGTHVSSLTICIDRFNWDVLPEPSTVMIPNQYIRPISPSSSRC